MCAQGHRPICQDTGIVVAFVEIGQAMEWEFDLEPAMDLEACINRGV